MGLGISYAWSGIVFGVGRLLRGLYRRLADETGADEMEWVLATLLIGVGGYQGWQGVGGALQTTQTKAHGVMLDLLSE